MSDKFLLKQKVCLKVNRTNDMQFVRKLFDSRFARLSYLVGCISLFSGLNHVCIIESNLAKTFLRLSFPISSQISAIQVLFEHHHYFVQVIPNDLSVICNKVKNFVFFI